MPLDPVIAGGFRGLQLQDPLEQFGRISQIQQAQQQNALNALKMQEYQREMETENRLRALYARPDVNIRSPEFQREVFSVSPTRGAAMQKSALEAEREQRLSDAALADLETKRITNARAMLPAVTPETWGAWRADTIKKLPGLANMIPEAYSDDAKLQLMQTADQYIASRKPMVVAPGASVFQPGATAPAFTAPAAPPAPSEVVKLNRELAAAQAAGDTALAADLKARITRLTEKPVGTTIVNKLPEQEKAERGERGKLLVAEYKVVSDAARLATRMLPALETQERVLDSGFRTGFGAEAQKAGASLLAALGVPEAEGYATNAQTFSAAMNQAVLQKQLEQKGVQTQADADRITQTGAQLTNTADANRFIIAVARAQLKRDIAQRNFYDKWWKENKTYDGAEDAWATGEGNKSLFEDPALKKFAPAPAKPAPAAAPAAAATGTQPFSDAAKERRYQEWKRNQGKP